MYTYVGREEVKDKSKKPPSPPIIYGVLVLFMDDLLRMISLLPVVSFCQLHFVETHSRVSPFIFVLTRARFFALKKNYQVVQSLPSAYHNQSSSYISRARVNSSGGGYVYDGSRRQHELVCCSPI